MKIYEELGITLSELENALTNCVLQAKAKAQDTVPIDTGNMRYAAFKHKKTGHYTHRVYFDLGASVIRDKQTGEKVIKQKKHVKTYDVEKFDGIAPYAKWTNEKPCKVQGWFDNKTVQRFTEELAFVIPLMLINFGISVDSVEIIQKEEETTWNTSNT